MTPANYEKAATIVQRLQRIVLTSNEQVSVNVLIAAFVEFFSEDNENFDCDRFNAADFRRACTPGAAYAREGA